MGFGKLPQPVFGGAWGRGSEDAALLHAACGGRGQCELDGERRQDVVPRQEQQRSRQGITELGRVQLAFDWKLLQMALKLTTRPIENFETTFEGERDQKKLIDMAVLHDDGSGCAEVLAHIEVQAEPEIGGREYVGSCNPGQDGHLIAHSDPLRYCNHAPKIKIVSSVGDQITHVQRQNFLLDNDGPLERNVVGTMRQERGHEIVELSGGLDSFRGDRFDRCVRVLCPLQSCLLCLWRHPRKGRISSEQLDHVIRRHQSYTCCVCLNCGRRWH